MNNQVTFYTIGLPTGGHLGYFEAATAAEECTDRCARQDPGRPYTVQTWKRATAGRHATDQHVSDSPSIAYVTWGQLRAEMLVRVRGIPDAEAEALKFAMGPFPMHADTRPELGRSRLTVHAYDDPARLFRVTGWFLEVPH